MKWSEEKRRVKLLKEKILLKTVKTFKSLKHNLRIEECLRVKNIIKNKKPNLEEFKKEQEKKDSQLFFNCELIKHLCDWALILHLTAVACSAAHAVQLELWGSSSQ